MTTHQLYDGTSFVSQSQDNARELSLVFALYGSSPRDLRAIRRQLIELFAHNPTTQPQPFPLIVYPNDDRDDPDGQPLICYCYYVDGMEGVRNSYYTERVAIRLQTTTAWFSEVYGEVQPFGTVGSPFTVGQVMYRSPDGEWEVVTPNSTQYETFSDPFTPNQAIYAIGFLGETVVFGGSFLNVEGNAAFDYMVGFNPLTNVKTIVGDGVNARVRTLAKGENIHQGKLFISGDFTANASGARTSRRYAIHPGGAIGTALTFPAVGLANGAILGFAFHLNGRVYVAGSFTQLSNGTNVPGLAYADASTLNLGRLGLRNTVTGAWTCAVAGPDGLIYFGGYDGATVDGDAVGPVISYEPATGLVRAMGARLNGRNVWALSFGADGYLYAVGTALGVGMGSQETR